MTTILRIDASSRPAVDPAGGEGSFRRELADRISRCRLLETAGA